MIDFGHGYVPRKKVVLLLKSSVGCIADLPWNEPRLIERASEAAKSVSAGPGQAAFTGRHPLRFSALNGPGSTMSRRAASTCSQTFHSTTPRTRPAFK